MKHFSPDGTEEPFNPSIRDKVSRKVAGLLKQLGLDYDEDDIADTVGSVVDFVPGLGDVVGIEETKRSYDDGDYLGAGINAAGTLVGFIPGVGDVAGKAIKKVGHGAAEALGVAAKKKIKDMAPEELRAYKAAKQAEARAKKREAELAAGVEVKGRGRPVGSTKAKEAEIVGKYSDDIDELANTEVQHDLVDELTSSPSGYAPEPDRILNEELFLRGQLDRPFTEKDRREAAARLFTERQKSDSLDKSVSYHARKRAGQNPGAGKPPTLRDRFNTQEIVNADGSKRLYDQNFIEPSADPHKRYDLQGDTLHANSRLKRAPEKSENWIEDVLDDIQRNGPADEMSALDEVYEEAIRNRIPEGVSFTQGEGKVKGFHGPGKTDGDVVSERYLRDAEYLPDESILGQHGRKFTQAEHDSELKKLRDEAAKKYGKKASVGEAKLNPITRDLLKQLSPQDLDYMFKEVPFKDRLAWVQARLSK
ncbi:hypothetical protein [Phyllobacterium sp. SB3]|uniref:hypothetical protein n=1 Tax=Phyllobacterium sp. SB3 TaxID=3156073 RepID=UPI0032B01A92